MVVDGMEVGRKGNDSRIGSLEHQSLISPLPNGTRPRGGDGRGRLRRKMVRFRGTLT